MFFKRLSPRTLFSLTPSRSSSPYSIAQCSTSSPSHLTYPHPASRNVRVFVWWDLYNCTVPPEVNALRVPQTIAAAAKSSGIKGPIEIKVFGDIFETNRWALTSTGAPVFYAPPGGNKLDMYLKNWALQNPPPAHILFIGGSSGLLHTLRQKEYNILLASKEPAPAALCRAATMMWNWDALVRGQNLTVSYFNQPPDRSWYGHYEGPLEDPFTVERPAFAPDDDDQPGEVLLQHEVDQDFLVFEIYNNHKMWVERKFENVLASIPNGRELGTWENLAFYLQEHGPSVTKSVTKSDVLLIVDMLISEKK